MIIIYRIFIFWNIHSPQPDILHDPQKYSFIPYEVGGVSSLAYNLTDTRLATGTNNGGGYGPLFQTASARIWDPQSRSLLAAPLDGKERDGEINGLAYSSDGSYLIAAHTGHGGRIDFIDAKTFKAVDALYAYEFIGAIAVNPIDSMFVATGVNKLLIWTIK